MIPVVADSQAAAERLHDAGYVSAEFIYQPRPTEPRARQVFDYALRTRLAELSRTPAAALLLVARDEATLASLTPLLVDFPALPLVGAIVNPSPVDRSAPDGDARTPWLGEWDAPDAWRRYALTDRWARILFALDVARRLAGPGNLIMPANDAVWGSGLLRLLTDISRQHAQAGLPAVVSPYTPWQHAPVPGVDIAPLIIGALNAGFNRSADFHQRVLQGLGQAFWGKMGLLPFGVCDTVYQTVERLVWEDDLEIDRVLKQAGYAVRCRWVDQRSLYCQALPVFDRAGLRRVFDRTLHYSLNVPAPAPGGSLLNTPLDAAVQLRRRYSRRFDAALALSEALVAECNAAIAERLARYGMSWVDWGAYRYVVRVGDPWVQVWKYETTLI